MNVILLGKRVLTRYNHIKAFLTGKFPGLSRQALDVIMRVFLSGRQRRKPYEDGAKRDLKILSTGLEDGARDHETRKTKNVGLDAGNTRKGFSPRASQGSMALLTPWFQCSETDFGVLPPESMRINVYYFKLSRGKLFQQS